MANRQIQFDDISRYKGPSLSPGFLLWRISSLWRSSIESVLKPLNLTHPQFVVLATLGWLTRNEELVSQIAIGKMAGIDPNTLSQIIRGMEKKGLLVRKASSDGRVKNPYLTSQGRAIVKKALPLVEAADGEFFGALEGAEMKNMLHVFQQLATKN